MDESVTDPVWSVCVAVLDAGLAPQRLPTPTVGDSAQLLDVDVDQLTGAFPLIATDHLTRRAVHPRQSVDPQAGEHPVDCRRRYPQSVTDAGGAELERPPQLLDLCLDRRGGLMGTG